MDPRQIASTVIAREQELTSISPLTIEERPIRVGDANAPIIDGWIRMPQTPPTGGRLVITHDQVRLNTTALDETTGNADLSGLDTGDSVVAHLNAQGRCLRKIVTTPSGCGSGEIRPSSRKESWRERWIGSRSTTTVTTDNVVSHPTWVPRELNDALAVPMIDIAQLQTDGCAEITDTLDVLVTAAHPALGNVSVTMTGPGGPYSFTPPGSAGDTDRFGTASLPPGSRWQIWSPARTS